MKTICSIGLFRWNQMARSCRRTGRRWDQRRLKVALQMVWSWRNGRSDLNLLFPVFGKFVEELKVLMDIFLFWRQFVGSRVNSLLLFLFDFSTISVNPLLCLLFCSELCDYYIQKWGFKNVFHVIKCRFLFFGHTDIFISFLFVCMFFFFFSFCPLP